MPSPADPPPADPLPARDPDDEVPGYVVRAHRWALRLWPRSTRRRVATIVAVVALVVGTLAASARLLGYINLELDLVAYLGLALVCWIGAGGALVPIPGVRPLSWLMIVHQGAALDPVVVAVVAALAMALGKTSYYVTARLGERRLHAGDHPVAGAAAVDRAPPVAAPAPSSDGAALVAGRVTGDTEQSVTDAAGTPDGIVGRSRRQMARARDWVSRNMRGHPVRTVFLLSIVPSPLTTVAAAYAGALDIGFRRFFVASLAGFLVLTVLLVIAGRTILAAGEAVT